LKFCTWLENQYINRCSSLNFHKKCYFLTYWVKTVSLLEVSQKKVFLDFLNISLLKLRDDTLRNAHIYKGDRISHCKGDLFWLTFHVDKADNKSTKCTQNWLTLSISFSILTVGEKSDRISFQKLKRCKQLEKCAKFWLTNKNNTQKLIQLDNMIK